MQYMAYFVRILTHKYTHFITIMMENIGACKYFCQLRVYIFSNHYILYPIYNHQSSLNSKDTVSINQSECNTAVLQSPAI